MTAFDRASSAARRLRLCLDGPVSGFLGGRTSLVPGPGSSFSGYRDYQYGDDARMIDWNVFARQGRPSIKVFQQDRASELFLVVDASASMCTADPRKWTAALEATSLVAILAASNGDRVGCAAVTDRVELAVRPRPGERHARAMLRALASLRPGSIRTSLDRVLPVLARELRRNSTLLIVSDGLDSDARTPRWARSLRHVSRHQVAVILVASPVERQLDAIGLLEIRDVETGATQWVDTSDATVRQAFARSATVRRRDLLQELRRSRAIAVEVAAELPVIPQLEPLVQGRRA